MIVQRGGNNLATINLSEKKVDCQDEYMRMRFYGILDEYFGEYNEAEEEDEGEDEGEDED